MQHSRTLKLAPAGQVCDGEAVANQVAAQGQVGVQRRAGRFEARACCQAGRIVQPLVHLQQPGCWLTGPGSPVGHGKGCIAAGCVHALGPLGAVVPGQVVHLHALQGCAAVQAKCEASCSRHVAQDGHHPGQRLPATGL